MRQISDVHEQVRMHRIAGEVLRTWRSREFNTPHHEHADGTRCIQKEVNIPGENGYAWRAYLVPDGEAATGGKEN